MSKAVGKIVLFRTEDLNPDGGQVYLGADIPSKNYTINNINDPVMKGDWSPPGCISDEECESWGGVKCDNGMCLDQDGKPVAMETYVEATGETHYTNKIVRNLTNNYKIIGGNLESPMFYWNIANISSNNCWCCRIFFKSKKLSRRSRSRGRRLFVI